MFEIIKAVIFGIVEGITEWLPISSTGHLILLNEFIKLNVSEEFFETFDVVIQLGAISAVVIVFFWHLWPFYIKGKGTKTKFNIKQNDPAIGNIALSLDALRMWIKIVIACIPAIIYAFILDEKIEPLMKSNIGKTNITIETMVIAIMLIVVGILFIIIENKNKNKEPKVTKISKISYTHALLIGLCQLVAAILPGTSRSGSTIIGGLCMGIERSVIVEFTFFLGIPVMFGASLLKLLKHGLSFTGLEIGILLTGMIVSFIVSLIVIRFIINYIKTHDFKVFGYYRIVLGLVVLLYFALKALF